jgi:hypothetical protein
MNTGDLDSVQITSRPSTMLDRVTSAIYRVAVQQAETDAAKYDIPLEAITSALGEAIDAPDRTTAIVVFALIDDLMISFLSKNLNPQIRGGLDALFGPNGYPLPRLYETFGLVRLTRLGCDVPWVKA